MLECNMMKKIPAISPTTAAARSQGLLTTNVSGTAKIALVLWLVSASYVWLFTPDTLVSVRTSRLIRPVVLGISRTGRASPAKTLDGTGPRVNRLLYWRQDGPLLRASACEVLPRGSGDVPKSWVSSLYFSMADDQCSIWLVNLGIKLYPGPR